MHTSHWAEAATYLTQSSVRFLFTFYNVPVFQRCVSQVKTTWKEKLCQTHAQHSLFVALYATSAEDKTTYKVHSKSTQVSFPELAKVKEWEKVQICWNFFGIIAGQKVDREAGTYQMFTVSINFREKRRLFSTGCLEIPADPLPAHFHIACNANVVRICHLFTKHPEMVVSLTNSWFSFAIESAAFLRVTSLYFLGCLSWRMQKNFIMLPKYGMAWYQVWQRTCFLLIMTTRFNWQQHQNTSTFYS